MNTSLGAFIVQGAAVTYGRSLPNYSSRNFPGHSGVPWYFPGVKRGHSQMAPFLWRGGPRSTLCRTVLPFWLKVDFGAMAPISFPTHHPRAAPGRPREIIVAMLPNHTYRTYNIYGKECNVSLTDIYTLGKTRGIVWPVGLPRSSRGRPVHPAFAEPSAGCGLPPRRHAFDWPNHL